MPALQPPESVSDSVVPVLLANLAPLVGVAFLGWDAAALTVVYTAEVLLSLPLAGFEALFAQRRPPAERDGVAEVGETDLTAKRGGTEVVGWLPPVYPRNVPFATRVVTGSAWFAVFVVVGVAETVDLGAVLARESVLIGLAGLVVTSVGGSAWSYFARREYETTSPYAVIETPSRRVFFLVCLLFVAPILGDIFGTAAFLAVVVLGKVVVEYAAHGAESGETGRITGWLAGPDDPAASEEPVSVPDGDPEAAFATDRRTVLIAAVARTLPRVAPTYAVFCFFVWLVGAGLLVGGDASPVELAGVALPVFVLYCGALGLRVAASYLRFAPLEYRQYGDRVVAYDTWLDEAQWSAPLDHLRDVNVVTDRVADRLTRTRTFELTVGWDDEEFDRQIGPVTDPEEAIEAFDLPVSDTTPRPLDRRMAAAGALIILTYAAALVAVVRWATTDSLLLAVFVFPFVALAATKTWRRSYPDRVDRSQASS